VSANPKSETIEVTGFYEEDLPAHAADLHVTVHGSSLVTGRAVLNKAKEVAAIVESLRQVGVVDAQIQVVSVRAEVKSGLLTKSSSASYVLKVHCAELEQLPAMLGAVTAAKNAELDRLEWLYAKDAAHQGRLLAEATALAKHKALAIAGALGVSLGKPLEVREVGPDDVTPEPTRFGAPMAALRARAEPVELGVQLQHSKRVSCTVRLSYAIA
jgi:uncharacterized protein YggE